MTLSPSSPALWLSSEILRWTITNTELRTSLDDPGSRQHEFLEHADRLLASAHDPLTLADAIENLNKAVSQRVAKLTEVFSLKTLRKSKHGKDSYELLEALGVIRPRMRGRLNDIRNAVNHEDAIPPDMDECLELAEFVWYFLRSTDGLVRIHELQIALQEPIPAASRHIATDLIRIRALPHATLNATCEVSVRSAYLSETPKAGHIRLTLESSQLNKIVSPSIGFITNGAGMVELSATTVCSPEQEFGLARIYFLAAMRLV